MAVRKRKPSPFPFLLVIQMVALCCVQRCYHEERQLTLRDLKGFHQDLDFAYKDWRLDLQGSGAMVYLAHSAHAQLGALAMGCVGWTFTAMALGLIQWRVWHVTGSSVISSGVALVGIWRACFNSYTLVTPGFRMMYCREIGLTDSFTPPEIVAAQVLVLLALFVGFWGIASGIYALRNIYFGLAKSSHIRSAFFAAGALCSLAAVMSLIPLVWNLNSVMTNQTVSFPPQFKMPPAPDAQSVGGGIVVGMLGAVLMIVSGIMFCAYRFPDKSEIRNQTTETEAVHPGPSGTVMTPMGRTNLGYASHEEL